MKTRLIAIQGTSLLFKQEQEQLHFSVIGEYTSIHLIDCKLEVGKKYNIYFKFFNAGPTISISLNIPIGTSIPHVIYIKG